MRGQRLVWRPAPEPSFGRDERRVRVVGHAPTRRPGADPAGTALQTPTDQPVDDPAARALHRVQGRHGLYFSGQYTTGFDSQESAVYSAMKVADSWAPASQTLASLKTLLTARGLAGISYDL